MTKTKRLALAVGMAAGLHGAADAHGNVPIEQDRCAHQIRASWLHYSAYQPSHDPKAEYCEEIPHVGDTIVVIDIIGGSLREQALAVRVQGPDESGVTKTLLELPARLHANGVVNATVKFDVPGKYVVSVVSADGRDELDRMELLVASFNWQKKLRQLLFPALLSVLLVWLGYRAKRWLSIRSTGRHKT